MLYGLTIDTGPNVPNVPEKNRLSPSCAHVSSV